MDGTPEWIVEPLSLVCEPRDAPLLVRMLIRTVGFFPYQVAGFSVCVSMFDTSPLMTFLSYAMLAGAYWYFYLLAAELQYERAAGFPSHLCGASRYALPDAHFVTSVAYVIALSISIARHRVYAIRVSRFRAATIVAYVLAYCASTIASGYFTPQLLAINALIAVMLALMCVVLFDALKRRLWSHASRTVRKRLEFVASLLGVTPERTSDV